MNSVGPGGSQLNPSVRHTRARMTSRPKPPPILNGARVLAYASMGQGRRPSADGLMFVGNKPLARVSRLVITEAPGVSGRPGPGVLLLCCTQAWSLIGVAGHSSVAHAKRRAETMFPGSSTRWVPSKVTKTQAEKYLKKVWAGQECSFCGKRPDQIRQMVAGKGVRICDRCISEYSAIMRRSGSERGA